MNEQHHEMILEKTYSSGAQEWGCLVCGRRFLVQWPPAFHMFILEPGDQNARHSGSTGPIQMGPTSFTKGNEIRLSEGRRLAPWQKWMDEVDFDNRWSKDL